ncbi:hypothetical protein KL86PLE_30202 [uncultured Pleomorphomonas sp.]|uniref:Uncharacterized protein n=1 Tax=uncultured Pleomorphomonas sp. TaxID=442121 RepID=A0A212LE02_9HYPH|nr:hypothetical protein KL86PLE_30202 [uncultured Pleomorphomonas sp.]
MAGDHAHHLRGVGADAGRARQDHGQALIDAGFRRFIGQNRRLRHEAAAPMIPRAEAVPARPVA